MPRTWRDTVIRLPCRISVENGASRYPTDARRIRVADPQSVTPAHEFRGERCSPEARTNDRSGARAPTVRVPTVVDFMSTKYGRARRPALTSEVGTARRARSTVRHGHRRDRTPAPRVAD